MVAQMAGLRDQVPEQLLDPARRALLDLAGDLEHVDRLAVAIARELEVDAVAGA